MSSAGVLLFVFSISALALARVAIDTPSNVEQCSLTSFKWSGGTPPYSILFNTTKGFPTTASGGQTNVSIIEGLGYGNIPDTSYSALLYFDPGSKIQMQVTDSTSSTSSPVTFTLQSGSSSKCKPYFSLGNADITGVSSGETLKVQSLMSPGPCEPFGSYFTWTGGVPPYTMAIQTVGLPVTIEQIFGGIQTTLPYASVQFPPGVEVSLAVEDITGAIGVTPPASVTGLVGSPECFLTNDTSSSGSSSATKTLPIPTFFSLRPTATSATASSGSSPSGSSPFSKLAIKIAIPVGIAILVGGSLFHKREAVRHIAVETFSWQKTTTITRY